jgi:hypothetical protein
MGETANFKTWGGFKRLQIFTRLPKTSIDLRGNNYDFGCEVPRSLEVF